ILFINRMSTVSGIAAQGSGKNTAREEDAKRDFNGPQNGTRRAKGRSRGKQPHRDQRKNGKARDGDRKRKSRREYGEASRQDFIQHRFNFSSHLPSISFLLHWEIARL